MIKWEDKYRKEAVYASELKLGKFTLVVHRFVGYPKDMWLASSYGIFENKELASKDLAQAKIQAIAILQVMFEDALKDILEFGND